MKKQKILTAKKICTGILVLLLGISFFSCGASKSVKKPADSRYFGKFAAEESAWLASTQLDNGALPDYDVRGETVDVIPYNSDFVALALLDSGKKYSGNVRKYMNWYFSHMNTAGQDVNGLEGTVYDYKETVSAHGHVTAEKPAVQDGRDFYDSTDSYAALFLSVLWKYYYVTGDRSYMVKHRADIDRLVNVIYGTMHDGLTYATPSYRVKYLMDNCEVYAGLNDAGKIYSKVFNANTGKVDSAKNSVRSHILKEMWNSRKSVFVQSIDESGKVKVPEKTDISVFYPDATSQLFPVTEGVVAPNSVTAKKTYAKFNSVWSSGKKHHSWEKLDTTDENCWGAIAYAAALMGDRSRVKTYVSYYQKKYSAKHQYPLFTADSAKTVLAAEIMGGR